MRAARLHAFGDVRLDTVPDPVPRDGEVVVDVACVQVSVTECMLLQGHEVALHEQLAHRLADGPVQFGGHEFAGVVRSVGPGVDVGTGQRVTAVETVTCTSCGPCRRGFAESCLRPEFLGFTRPGALAERIVVPARCLVAVPSGVSASAAAAVQPLAGALHAHDSARVRPGESVLVVGAGVMGLLAVQVARLGNAGLVAVAGRSPDKLALAERFGADALLTTGDDVVATAHKLTGGVGFDVVVETAGGAPELGLAGAATLDTAVRAVRRGGRVVVVSVLPEGAAFPFGLVRERALTLLHPPSGAGTHSPSADVFTHALHLVSRGDVDVESLVTHRLDGIDELPRAVEITLDKRRHGAMNPAQLHLASSWDAR